MKVVLGLILILISGFCFSQNNLNYSILIESSCQGRMINTVIVRESKQIIIYNNRHLRISEKGMRKAFRLWEKRKNQKDLIKREKADYLKRLKDIEKKYSTYERDTLLLATKENPGYLKTINEIHNTETHRLNWNITNKNRFILDGTSYSISIIENGKVVKKAYSHSPTKETYPEQYKLISETRKMRAQNK